ncbi:MAG: carnitine dehydratase [Rhodospirillales bacterium CG15_BIG_FIL_POST_REV_8_21_14_020_66_15]|nr:MAG: carnitine dehydratase [Rhodospirillales bacterium CG15_BIG_FIL_POST_REV_8_21_14_020_66_15]
MAETPTALDGVRVIDIATFIAGPYAASILGEFGAEVVKVEQPDKGGQGGGDPWRRYGTPTARADSTLAWLTEARNKKSVTLNLREAEGQELLKRLLKDADVLIENFRPGTLERWGLGPEALHALNPGLVILRVTGYGQTGPYKDRPGFARIGHAVGGLTYLSGRPGEIPVTPGSTSLGDYMTGMYGAIGILMALRHRDKTGEGQVIDAALYESVFRVLDELAPAYAARGTVREPEGTGTLNAVPHGHFPCGDGKFLSIACTTSKMFERLTQAMDRPDLWEAYGDQAARLKNRDRVIEEVTAWCLAMTREQVMEKCVAAEVPAGPINSIADIFEDPHFRARDQLVTLDDPEVGEVTIPGVIPKLSKTPGRIKSLGQGLGASNGEVYGGLLGLSEAEIADLTARGII